MWRYEVRWGYGDVPRYKKRPVRLCMWAGWLDLDLDWNWNWNRKKKVPKYDKSEFAIPGDGDLGQATLFPSGWRWLSLSIYAHSCYRVKLSSRYCTHVCDFRASDINKTNERINNHAWHSCTSFFMSFSSLFILWHSLVLRRFNI